jgi:hypothetical protein
VDEPAPDFGDRTAPAKRAGEAASAAAALPLLLELVPNVTSLVHVGLGGGEWLAEAQRLGVRDVHGIDGPWASSDDLLVPADQVTVADTTRPFDLGRRFDLAICVEYAEHLPDSRAASFVADLAKLAPVVAFSAAIPGQGGVGHINEQWPDYWSAHFESAGYRMVDAVRRQLWTATTGPAYLAQNLLIAVDNKRLGDYPRLAEVAARDGAGVLSIVHPAIYQAKLRRREHTGVPGVRASVRQLGRSLASAARRRRR